MTPMRGGTARNFERETDGPIVGRFAALLGTPLLPWQQYVADVAGEIDPDTGTYFYNTVILTTQRQCGKSTLIDTEDTRNALWGPNRFIYYLAQTGKDASKHFKKYLKQIQASPLVAATTRPYLGAGDISQPFINGSVIMPESVTKVAGHGVQGDKITLDEAFSLSEETGKTILDGFLPTMATRLKATGVQPQVWITSTEGTSDSTFFNKRLDSCREGDVKRRTCWFDWGLPADENPEDLDAIMRYHPAAGLLWGKSQLKDFRDLFDGDAAGWARAFGNRRDEGTIDRAIDERLWADTASTPVTPGKIGSRPVTLGVAVDVDATHTSISAGIKNGDGTITTQLLKVLDGTGYAPDEIKRLAETYHAPVTIDTKGTASDLSDRLRHITDEYGYPVLRFCELSAADYLTIGQSYVSGLENHGVTHAADPELDASAANSARTWSGDAWRVTRRRSTGLTSPLESCMLAAWGVNHQPANVVPVIV
ncbi:hypothetical protein OZX62_01595 [Bifidobacterium sp. ESL0690]|nr:hypothetical protein [Bifidobacterium sp. ESL0690]WEV47698.1 hypothetical protein OZX62_01595 [Bifidobacterium sp. ESL0690]